MLDMRYEIHKLIVYLYDFPIFLLNSTLINLLRLETTKRYFYIKRMLTYQLDCFTRVAEYAGLVYLAFCIGLMNTMMYGCVVFTICAHIFPLVCT